MKRKYLILLSILLFVCFSLFGFYSLNKEEKFNCNEFGIVYLTPEEIQYASSLADKINGIVYIPETNQIIGRTEIFECENTYFLDKFMFGDN